jgi:hypothetical protein
VFGAHRGAHADLVASKFTCTVGFIENELGYFVPVAFLFHKYNDAPIIRGFFDNLAQPGYPLKRRFQAPRRNSCIAARLRTFVRARAYNYTHNQRPHGAAIVPGAATPKSRQVTI